MKKRKRYLVSKLRTCQNMCLTESMLLALLRVQIAPRSKFGPGGGVQSRSPDSIVSVDDGDDGLLWEDAESSTGEKEKKKRRLLKANIFDQATQKCQ